MNKLEHPDGSSLPFEPYVPPKRDLPAPGQLAAYRSLIHRLETGYGHVSQEEKAAFRDLVLCLSPDELEPSECALVEKLFPQDWKSFCEFHCGEDAGVDDSDEGEYLCECCGEDIREDFLLNPYPALRFKEEPVYDLKELSGHLKRYGESICKSCAEWRPGSVAKANLS